MYFAGLKFNLSSNKRLFSRLVTTAMLLVCANTLHANVYDAPAVHDPAFPILDEDGVSVLQSGKPYSSKKTCGGCHDYEKIAHSFHFESGRDEASDDYGAMRGLPQLVSSGYFGGYNCMGSNNPDSLAKKSNSSSATFGDLGSAGLVMRCESCHAGGGWMEKDRNGVRYDEKDPSTVEAFDGDYFNRGTDADNHPAASSVVSQWSWKKSGVVENDCLKCHVDLDNLVVPDGVTVTASSGDALGMADSVRRYVFIDDGHFRESNTAILEVLNINTSGDPAQDKTLVTFARTDKETVDHSGNVVPADGSITDVEVDFAADADGDLQPQLNWNPNAFTAEGKVEMPMVRFPANDHCMDCHVTSNSRRGFYGFGEGASAVYDEEDGTIEEDYQDDVHKGKTWTEANGESRTIENCNVCHSRNYFNPPHANADVDASHDFLKGNSDMDVHNDKDYSPNAKSCEYCHDNSNPAMAVTANPSGDSNMQDAHEKLWKLSGDMSGQPAGEVAKITKAHLDVVSCQACHITDKAVRGTPFEPMFRYREDENGKQTIIPYKPKPRYYWKDKNNNVVLNKTQRDSIYQAVYDADGNLTGGKIVDPETGATITNVTAYISHGSVRFGDPATYDDFVGLKMAYDKVLSLSGVTNPDAVLVWSEINQYLISHNTRPAVSSVQCAECHSYKQDGTTISALISDDGILGKNNGYEITTVLDPRLVENGIIVFDYPYMKMNNAGVVSATVSDILSYSRVDPSMSALKSAVARIATAQPSMTNLVSAAMASSGISNADDVTKLLGEFRNSNVYHFQTQQGDAEIRKVMVMSDDATFNGHTLQVAVADSAVSGSASGAGLGDMVAGAEVFSLEFHKPSGDTQSVFVSPVVVKLPYSGSSNDPSEVNIITSADGSAWSLVDPANLLVVRAKTDLEDGYIVFKTTHFSYYTVTAARTADAASAEESSSEGGGTFDYFILMFGLFSILFSSIRFKRVKGNK